MNIALVVNSKSGGGKGKRFGEKIARTLTQTGLHFTLIRERSLSETLITFERIHQKDPFSTIISVGGDGLAHAMFPSAIKYRIPLLVAPAGTGNDFSRSVGTFGLKAEQLVQLIREKSPANIDMGLIKHGDTEIWFGQVLSTGFDSLVNERANSYRFIRGKLKYVIATARELPFFVPRTYKITIDGKEEESGSMLVAIANGKSYGGGMQVCPDANAQDGLFDVLLLKPIPVREFIRVFPRVFSGNHIGHRAVQIRRCSSITLQSNAIAYADGERIGSLPISATVVPLAMLTWIA